MIFNKYLFITESLHFFGTEKTSSAKSFSDSCSSIGIMSEVLILVFSLCDCVFQSNSAQKCVCNISCNGSLYLYISFCKFAHWTWRMMVETKRGKGDSWNIASNPKTQTLLIASHCVLLSMVVFYPCLWYIQVICLCVANVIMLKI